ncbi:MAG: tetratricopeptide repeat protein [Phycisphaerales bacterium]
MSETASAPAPTSPWIIGRGADLALIVATPLLIIPLFFGATQVTDIQSLALYILAFGALGHHLPGMMRAYGDKGLFREFRLRFILAPIALAAACIFLFWNNLRVAILVIYVWGLWHGLMQTYGFVRIYDAKAGSVRPVTQKLDFAMCIAWFLTGVLMSPARRYQLVEYYHVNVGGPLPPEAILHAIPWVAVGATALITLAFLVNHVRLARAGESPSHVKLILLATSFGFWWWANMFFSNMLVGVILFEVFHDVQYLTIVWVFNQARAKKDPNAGGFTRFLFKRGGMLVGLYVGLVFAYGSLRFVERGIDDANMKSALAGLLAASTLLHFYYDGFIWKFRKKQNTEALDIRRDELESRRFLLPGRGWAHAFKWAVIATPLGLLAYGEVQGRSEVIPRLTSVAEIMPGNPFVHHEIGEYHHARRENDLALVSFRRALDLGIETPETGYYYGVLLMNQADDRTTSAADQAEKYEASADALEASIRHNPHSAATHGRLGDVYVRLGRTDEAAEAFDRALKIDPQYWRAHFGLAEIDALNGDVDGATAHIMQGIGGQDAAPSTEGGAVGMLAYDAGGGLHYERMKKVKDEREQPEVVARRVYEVALRFDASDAPGTDEAAVELLAQAMELNPRSGRFPATRGWILGDGLGRWDEALGDLNLAYSLEPIPELLVPIATAQEALGQIDAAEQSLERALQQRPNLDAARQQLQRLRQQRGVLGMAGG